MQVTLLKLAERWSDLDERDMLTGYVRQMLRNVYISHYRTRRWSREIIQSEVPERAHEDPTLDEQTAVRAAVNQLAKRQRAVIVLRFWFDLSVNQTAALLHCSPGTVTSQTHHALKTLRAQWGSSWVPPAKRSPLVS